MNSGKSELRLVVDNLGPVEHASLSLKPLTVLIGGNNTGKTYLAQALYAARRAVRDSYRIPSDPLTMRERATLNDLILNSATREDDEFRPDFARLLFSHLPEDVQAKTSSWIHQALTDVGQLLERQMCATFGVSSMSELRRWDQPYETAVELRRVRPNGESASLCGTRGASVPELAVDMEIGIHPLQIDSVAMSFEDSLSNEEEERINIRASAALKAAAWHEYRGTVGLLGDAHYLPAGRSGLLNAWTDVVRLRMELERESWGLQTIRNPALDGVALDFISSLAELLGTRQTRPSSKNLLSRRRMSRRLKPDVPASLSLLRRLMSGEVFSGPGDDNVPTLEYAQEGHRIAIRRASSMVADLAPLAMWIDRILEPGDLLIVDEPESHLHPRAIRLIARVLVRLVGEGVSVVCATHSPVFLHELSNCLLLDSHKSVSHLDGSSDYETSDCLSLNDISVNRFYRSEPASPVRVDQVEIEPEWGIPEDEYVEVAMEQSEQTTRLIDALT